MDDISLLGYPVRLGALQQQHQDEIVREFQFLAVSSPESSRQVPGQLLEVDDYCRRGTLLALAAPAEVVALREWTLEEFLRQLDGQQPVRWSGPT